MKHTIVLAACMFLYGGTSFAQNSTKIKNDASSTQRSPASSGKCALTGYFTDARNRPLRGVEVFIYEKDSSISASGYSDSIGHYQTNAASPGMHSVKLVYPDGKTAFIPGITMKNGLNQLSLKADAPAADTTLDAAAVMPKPAQKAKSGSAKAPK